MMGMMGLMGLMELILHDIINIIYTPNMRSFGNVLGRGRKQGRFNQARERAGGEQWGSSGGAVGTPESTKPF